MVSGQCADVTVPGTNWTFCPDIAPAYAFCALFGLTFVLHVAEGIYYRKAYTWVIAMSALWQTIAYAFRIVSIRTPTSLGDYAIWNVLILVAPLWTNAFVYMAMGRMVWNFTTHAKVLGLTAWSFGTTFVCLDIVAFAIQIVGAVMAEEGPNRTPHVVLKWLHVYMAGVGVQQVFILIFLVFAIGFHRTLLREKILGQNKVQVMSLLYTLYIVLALITMRIGFRLAEYAHGFNSTIPNHEAYQYCLDSLPMMLALYLLNVIHPGRIMYGKECDMPSRKQRKHGLRTKDESLSSIQMDNRN